MASRVGIVSGFLKAIGLILAGMVLAGLAVSMIYPDTWQDVPATVQSTKIHEVRYGKPGWALRARASYDVGAQQYETLQDVYRNTDLDAVEAQAANWPVGRVFPIYVDARNPDNVSQTADGGREAAIVTAVILSPLIVGLVALIVVVMRRRRQA